MTIIIDIVLSVVLAITGYIAICMYLGGEKNRKFGKELFKLTANRGFYLMGIAVSCAAVIYVFHNLYDIPLISQLKLLTLILVIFPIAAIDYRIKKIPNVFVISAIIIRFVFYVVEFIDDANGAVNVLRDNLAGAFVTGIFFLILALIFKNSIGMGDIKLFWTMGLYQGMWGVVNSVFFSLCVSFFVSIFLLISKKKNKKDTIAFGPSILVGTIIAIVSAGM